MQVSPKESTGEAFLAHYKRCFGDPVAREMFRGHQVQTGIQVLAYDKVFPECMLFATLGLSLHANLVGRVLEVAVGADDGLKSVSRLIANALFFAMENRLTMGRGTSVGGIGQIDPAFALAFGKTAIYFTECQSLPTAFSTVQSDDKVVGEMLMGFFLSAPEEQLLLTQGVDALESRLEAERVDPFKLRRSSVV